MDEKKKAPDPSKAYTAKAVHEWMRDYATLDQLRKFRRWIDEIMQMDCKCGIKTKKGARL